MRGAGRIVALCGAVLACAGCSIGPRALAPDRIRYNEAVKTSGEEELLLNIVRLRYTDTPSSLSVTSLADQYEVTRNLGLTPFFTADAGGMSFGGYRSVVLPNFSVTRSSRPTLTYTPQDDQAFTQRLFTPLSLEALASLSKTTWPLATVFRLWLENMNWVSNAETASGPTPREPPEYAEFLNGIEALQRLTDRKLATIFVEERDEPVADELPANKMTAAAAVQAAKDGFEYRKDKDGNWRLIRKKTQPTLRFDESVKGDPDFATVCRVFGLDPARTTFDLTHAKLDPYFKDATKGKLDKLDLETRSLLQVLFFVSHGVDVPAPHTVRGIAPQTAGPDGAPFDWNAVVGGLFKVHFAEGKHPPACAHVAVRHKGYWFYIDERDRDTKATFTLLLELSRLQLSTDKGGSGPVLTLPVGGR
jgi:hypothetical protein